MHFFSFVSIFRELMLRNKIFCLIPSHWLPFSPSVYLILLRGFGVSLQPIIYSDNSDTVLLLLPQLKKHCQVLFKGFLSPQYVLHHLIYCPHVVKYNYFCCKSYCFSLCLFSYQFSSAIIFGNGAETNIPFTDNPVYKSLDVSRNAEGSKNSTFSSYSASGAQKCTVCPTQTMAIY